MPPDPEVQHVKGSPRRALTRSLARMRQDSGFRRVVFLGTTGTAVAAITLVTVILTVIALTSSADTADRLAAAGDVLVAATLLLAAVAALVALLAYAVSTGPPDLKLSIRFDSSEANKPIFSAEIGEDGKVTARGGKQIRGRISVRNDSGYSARNPAVVVRLRAMVYLPEDHRITRETDSTSIWASPAGHWAVIDFIRQAGIAAVQWDGGPTYSIHGHSTRALPDLRLERLKAMPDRGTPALIIEILAEGYRKEMTLPVNFVVDGKLQFPQEGNRAIPEWM